MGETAMEIKTKFKPGEIAWIMDNNLIKSVLVHEINVKVVHGSKMPPGFTIPFDLYNVPNIIITYVVVLSSHIIKGDDPIDIDGYIERNHYGIEIKEDKLFKTKEDLANWLVETASTPKINIS